MKAIKSLFIFTALLLCFIPTVLAEPQAQAIDESAPTTHFQQHNDEVDKLSKLLEISEVKAIYEQCSKKDPAVEMSNCLWNGDGVGGTIQGIAANENLMDKIQNKLDETLNDGNINQYESVTTISLKKETTGAQKKLEDFYLNKMGKEIFGEYDAQGKPVGGKHKIIDHTKFNTLYQNQLTKNILTGISSFCIEAKVIKKFPLISQSESKRKTQRITNVTSLKDPVSGGTNPLTGAEIASENWKNCFVNAQYLCHGGVKISKADDGTVSKKYAKTELGVKTCDDPSDCDASSVTDKPKCKRDIKTCKQKNKDYKYTKTRACELTNFLKVTRQNLKTVEKISAGYDQVFSKGGRGIQGTDSKNQANTQQVVIDKKIDTMTSVTSNEFINDSGFSDGAKEDLAELEKCIQADQNGNAVAIADANACKKFLNTDKEASEKLKAEHAIRLKALTEKVKKIDIETEDTKELESFLQDQGMSDDDIGNQLANVDIVKLKEQIISRYKREKEELIKSLNDEINKTTSTEDGKFDFDKGDASADLQKLKKIHSELSSKTESYAQLIHFNNVVSGFLDIEDQSGKKTRNTASVKRELANSAFSQDNLGKTGALGDARYVDQNETIQESLKNVELTDDGGEQGATLGVDKINTVILKYDTE
ncbi:hypothetical protein A9Q84_17530 [Halobacteriovorax marinus]|uniref:Uncharacterized protein n=1 Tax=Halobacteriovorax marinus TaxID=97084 RepID=A0A1Y5F3G2_9BACT|nr:hypothetical protein A9Q84_17530 [Halobacteriovorax marinus]